MNEHEPMSLEPSQRVGAARRLARLRYTAAQGARVAWYTGHYALLRRMSRGSASSGDSSTGEAGAAKPAKTPSASRLRLRAAFRALFDQDRANIEAGLYPPPRDLDPGRLTDAIEASRSFFADAREVNARRDRKDGVEARALDPAGRYPTYYRQNFHYQTDGWLSRRSARLYDTQVEVLFTGAADAMRRAALAEIARELSGKDQRKVALLDVACGTGRFLEQLMGAFPKIPATGADLSPAYVEEAAERLAAWPSATLVEANAESLPFETGAFDLAVSIFLFHELPPRVRRLVAEEMARVVKPGGLVVFADSLQAGDEPALDSLLEAFPGWFHEPFYKSYLAEDLDAIWGEAGLRRERATLAFLTKVRTYRKPG